MTAIFTFLFLLVAALAQAQIVDQLGWQTLTGTVLRNVCAGTLYPGLGDCDGITGAWNGAVMDTKRNRLLVWGGGHTDYYGNEIYSLNLNATPITLTRLNDPSTTGSQGSCVESIGSPAAPNSRHTYNGIQYLAHLDKFFVTGGSLACPAGGSSSATWWSDLPTLASSPQASWTNLSPSTTGGNPGTSEGKCSAYDRNTGKIFLVVPQSLGGGTNGVYRYDPVGNSWTRDQVDAIDIHMTCVIDPRRGTLWAFGANSQRKWDIHRGTAGAGQAGGTTGSTGIISTNYPGCDYDIAQDKIVCYNGNAPSTIYVLDLDSLSWSTQTYATNAPPTFTPCSGGICTLGRFRYSPASNAFILCQDVDSPCSALKLTLDSTAGADWARRCGDPGVMRCVQLNNNVDITGTHSVDPWGYIAGQATVVIDPPMAAVKFTMTSGQNGNANLFYNFSNDYSALYGANQTFYYSFRQYFGTNFLEPGHTGFKQALMGTGSKGTTSTNSASSCTYIELAFSWDEGYAAPFSGAYNGCPNANTVNYREAIGGGDYKLENARTSPYCLYSQRPAVHGGSQAYLYPPLGNCFEIHENEWITFKARMDIGTLSGGFWINSRYRIWAAHDGQGWEAIIDWQYPTLNDSGTAQQHWQGGSNPWSDQKYGQLWLLPRNTCCTPPWSNTVSTWYSQVIISRTDIAAPGQTLPQPPVTTYITNRVVNY